MIKQTCLFITGLALFLVLLLPSPVWAAPSTPPPEREPLTLELLTKRLNTPLEENGVPILNLRQLVIDLTPDNAEFRDQFYQQIREAINHSSNPTGIDFSQSLIQGEFKLRQLARQVPLAEGKLPEDLENRQSELQTALQLRQQSDLGRQITMLPYITVFPSSLKLTKTTFSATADFSQTFFLQRLEATGVTFEQQSDWSESSFLRSTDLSEAKFEGNAAFPGSYFLTRVKFSQAYFAGIANFPQAVFAKGADFEQAEFQELANWTRSRWQEEGNFSQATWHARVLFTKSSFLKTLNFTNAAFEKAVSFRETLFKDVVDFENVSFLEQLDFGNAIFVGATLNAAGLAFDSNDARILGDPGVIGNAFVIPQLEGNENVLKNLVRNFRRLEQIADANQLEYKTQKLRLKQISTRLKRLPFGQVWQLRWGEYAALWVGLNLLLLLSQYGTNFSLILSIGMLIVAYFGILFWLVDRWRKRRPQPILPTPEETVWILSSFALLTTISSLIIFQTAAQPWLTLACLGVILLPLPLFLVVRLYRQGRYHDLLDVTYFVEDGSMRQLRLLIVRLPIMPRFVFFRDRYLPILWERRWNWLNYYDFSLNNLLKLGFNDIRLRDEHLPGLISILVWYQWSLGMLYVALLFWTLSRTIPGLNLLIYLK